jgi:hypothetical protein
MKSAAAPRTQIVCPACQGALTHRLVVLHADADTLIVCGGVWESLPDYLRERFKQAKGLDGRRAAVCEIRDSLDV